MKVYYIYHFGECETDNDYSDLHPFTSEKEAREWFKQMKHDNCWYQNDDPSANTMTLYRGKLKDMSKKRLAIACLSAPMTWECFEASQELDVFDTGDYCGQCKRCKEVKNE